MLSNLLGSHVGLGGSRNKDDKGPYFSVLRSGRMKHNRRVGRTRGEVYPAGKFGKCSHLRLVRMGAFFV